MDDLESLVDNISRKTYQENRIDVLHALYHNGVKSG